MADPRIIELIKDYLKIGQTDQKEVNAHTSAFYSYLNAYEKILKDYEDAALKINNIPVDQQTTEEKEEALEGALKAQTQALADLATDELPLLFNLLKDSNNEYTPEYAKDNELKAIKAELEEIHKAAVPVSANLNTATERLRSFMNKIKTNYENYYNNQVTELRKKPTNLIATHLATDGQCAACARHIALEHDLPELAYLENADVLQNISASELPADLANWEHWGLYNPDLAKATGNKKKKTQTLSWETLSALYKLKATHEFIKAKGTESDVDFLLEKQAQTGKTSGSVSYADNRDSFTETRRYPDKIDAFVVAQNKEMTQDKEIAKQQEDAYKALDEQTVTLAAARMFLTQSSTAQDAKTVTNGFIQTYMGFVKEKDDLTIQGYIKEFQDFLNDKILFTYLIPASFERAQITPAVVGGSAIANMLKLSNGGLNINDVTATLPAEELAKLRRIFPDTGVAQSNPDSLQSFLKDYAKHYQNLLAENPIDLTPLQKREFAKLYNALRKANPNAALNLSFNESPPAPPSSPAKSNAGGSQPVVVVTASSSSSSKPVTAAATTVTTTHPAPDTPFTVYWNQIPHTETVGAYYAPAPDGTIALTDLVPNVKDANNGINATIKVGYSFWRDALPNSKKRPFVVIATNGQRHELDAAFFEGLENEDLNNPEKITTLNNKLKGLLANSDADKSKKVDTLLTQYSQQAVSAAVANPFNKTLGSYGTDTMLLATEESTQAIEVSFNTTGNIVLNVEYSDLKIKSLMANASQDTDGTIVNIPNSSIKSTLELRDDDFHVSPGKYSHKTLAGMYDKTTSIGDFTDTFKPAEKIFVKELQIKLNKISFKVDYYFNDINALRQLRILLELPIPADLSTDSLKQILTEGLTKNPSPTRLDLMATLMNYYATPDNKKNDAKFTGDMDRLFDKYSLNKKLVNIIERENVRRAYPQKGFTFYWKMAGLAISDLFQPLRVAILHSSSTFNDTSDAATFAAAKKAADNGQYDVAFETLNTLGTAEQAYVDYKTELKQKFERKLLARANTMADPNSNIAKAMTVQDIYNINKTLNLAGSDLNKTVDIETKHIKAFGLQTPKDKLLFQLYMTVEKRALQAEQFNAPNAEPLRNYATKLGKQLGLPEIDRTTPPANVDAVLKAMMVEKAKVSASTSSASTSAMMTTKAPIAGSPSKAATPNPNLADIPGSTDDPDNAHLAQTASQHRNDSILPPPPPPPPPPPEINPITGQPYGQPPSTVKKEIK